MAALGSLGAIEGAVLIGSAGGVAGRAGVFGQPESVTTARRRAKNFMVTPGGLPA
jgi:hypothetical protein